MLELPAGVGTASVTPRLIDAGTILRPPTGAAAQHFTRGGSRWAAEVALPPLLPDLARVVTRRLVGGRREGLLIRMPLIGVNQTGLGAVPQVDGATVGGAVVPLKGLTVGATLREGFWITLLNMAGDYCLHQVAADAVVNGAGKASVAVEPAIRVALPNNALVVIEAPVLAGLVTSDVGWDIPTNRRIALSFVLEEMA